MPLARDLDRRLTELAGRPRTRRGVLLGAGGLAAAAALSRLPLDLARAAAPAFASDPFALGIASGDPRPRGVVLWTRLAPVPLQADGGLDAQPVDVRWELARDEGMRDVVPSGRAVAWPAFAHSVHVEVDGLELFDGDRRGSLVARLSREDLEVDWRVAARVGSPDAPVWPLRRFTVEAGRPGVQV